jgi:hypothetical protein
MSHQLDQTQVKAHDNDSLFPEKDIWWADFLRAKFADPELQWKQDIHLSSPMQPTQLPRLRNHQDSLMAWGFEKCNIWLKYDRTTYGPYIRDAEGHTIPVPLPLSTTDVLRIQFADYY